MKQLIWLTFFFLEFADLLFCLSDGTTDTLKQQRWFIGVFCGRFIFDTEFWQRVIDLFVLLDEGDLRENWWNFMRNWVWDFFFFLAFFKPLSKLTMFWLFSQEDVGLITILGLFNLGLLVEIFFDFRLLRVKQFVQFMR